MHLTLQLEVLPQQWNITLGEAMSPGNWIRQDDGEEVSWNCCWSQGREKGNLLFWGAVIRFWNKDVQCSLWTTGYLGE